LKVRGGQQLDDCLDARAPARDAIIGLSGDSSAHFHEIGAKWLKFGGVCSDDSPADFRASLG
jgi:hypothetical protein